MVYTMVLTVHNQKHKSWRSILGRLRSDMQEKTKQHHLSWDELVTIVFKSKNTTVCTCSGATFGVQEATNLNRPCMDKSQRKERVNRYSVMPEIGTENLRKYHTPGLFHFSAPRLPCYDTILSQCWYGEDTCSQQNPHLPRYHQTRARSLVLAETNQSKCADGFWQGNAATESCTHELSFSRQQHLVFHRQIYSEKEH